MRTWLMAVVLLATASIVRLGFSGLLLQSPAQAPTLGTGYGDDNLFIGAFSSHGGQTYCMSLGAMGPLGMTASPEVQTTLGSLSEDQVARLNSVMDRWGESNDLRITSTVAMYVWNVADHDIYQVNGGDSGLIARVPAGQRATMLAHLGALRDEAAANAVAHLPMSIAIADRYHGALTITVNSSTATGPISRTNAALADSSRTKILGAHTYQITGTPPVAAPDYRGTAQLRAEALSYRAGADLFYRSGSQRILTASFELLKAQATSPVIPPNLQPVIGTTIAWRFVQACDPMVEKLALTVTKDSGSA